jgi:hypothetical protein
VKPDLSREPREARVTPPRPWWGWIRCKSPGRISPRAGPSSDGRACRSRPRREDDARASPAAGPSFRRAALHASAEVLEGGAAEDRSRWVTGPEQSDRDRGDRKSMLSTETGKDKGLTGPSLPALRASWSRASVRVRAGRGASAPRPRRPKRGGSPPVGSRASLRASTYRDPRRERFVSHAGAIMSAERGR